AGCGRLYNFGCRPNSAGFDPSVQGIYILRFQLACRGHLNIRMGLAYGLYQQALGRMIGDDYRSVLAAFQEIVARVEPQTTHLRGCVTRKTILGEYRAD